MTLQGANLFAGARVFFGAHEALSVARQSSSLLVVTSPPALKLGSVDVLVRNADDQQGVLASAFTYFATTPQITGVIAQYRFHQWRHARHRQRVRVHAGKCGCLRWQCGTRYGVRG